MESKSTKTYQYTPCYTLLYNLVPLDKGVGKKCCVLYFLFITSWLPHNNSWSEGYRYTQEFKRFVYQFWWFVLMFLSRIPALSGVGACNPKQHARTGVNQRTKVHFYSWPTFIEIIFLPGQPYHNIEFSSNFKHIFSKLIHLFVENHIFGLEFHFCSCFSW